MGGLDRFGLTARERELVLLLSVGTLHIHELAACLIVWNVWKNTVKSHLKTVAGKLGTSGGTLGILSWLLRHPRAWRWPSGCSTPLRSTQTRSGACYAKADCEQRQNPRPLVSADAG